MRPLISICCLAYNHEKYIAQTLDGMLSQKGDFDIEILIHDDASTDRTADIIRRYESEYPDIVKPIYQTENQYSKGIKNISGLYNFPRATGKYIAMCEGDDYWCDDTKLATQVEYMERHEQCSMTIHSAYQLVEGMRTLKHKMQPYKRDRVIEPADVIDKAAGYPTASLVFRKTCVEKLPDYYLDAPIGDIPMQLMAACKGFTYYFNRPMCVYRYGVSGSWTQSMLSGDYKLRQYAYADDMKKMYEEFDEYTTHSFHKEAVSAYRRIWYHTRVNTKDWQVIYDRRFRRYYRELSIQERILFRLEKTAPGLYSALQKAWQKTGA